MKKEHRSILVAMAVGDGYIGRSAGRYALRITHGMRQREYAEYKAALLREIFKSDVPTVYIRKNGDRLGCFVEKSSKYFRILRRWLYKDGVKQPSGVLRYLDEVGLAIWYMDDGSLSYKKRCGVIHARELTLNTYLSKEENEKIAKFLEDRWGFRLLPVRSKRFWRLRCGTVEAKKFISVVSPYIIESMSYKIDMRYRLIAPTTPTRGEEIVHSGVKASGQCPLGSTISVPQ